MTFESSFLQTYFIFIVGPNVVCLTSKLVSAFANACVDGFSYLYYVVAQSFPTDNKRPGLYSVSVSQMQLMEDNYVLLLIDKINKNLL